jgi:hypothetical protein
LYTKLAPWGSFQYLLLVHHFGHRELRGFIQGLDHGGIDFDLGGFGICPLEL